MKVIGYILLYFILTIGYYLLLSSVGCLFFDDTGKHISYKSCIGDITWFIIYLLFFHWWIVIFSLFEYYNKFLKDLKL